MDTSLYQEARPWGNLGPGIFIHVLRYFYLTSFHVLRYKVFNERGKSSGGSRESESESTDWSEGHGRGVTKAVTSRRASKKNNDNFQTNGYLEAEAKMRKAILKRTADVMEKLAIGSMLVGLFQAQDAGIWIGLGFLAASYVFTVWEAKS